MHFKNTRAKCVWTAKDIAFIAMFIALISVCAWISIPTAIPFTLQTFGIFLSVGLLGVKRGILCIALYLLLGAIGIPVYSGFSSGLGTLLGTTGGYLVGFFFSALCSGLLIEKFGHSLISLIFAFACGSLCCYILGTIWYLFIYTNQFGSIGIWSVIVSCILPFIIPDIIKFTMAAIAVKRLWKYF